MPESTRELIVFPTELALRRFQQEQALENGWVDASAHLTFARLRALCRPFAKIKGEPMDAARQLLMHRVVTDTAAGHFAGQGALGKLSSHALAEVLAQLTTEMATLPDEGARIVQWLLDQFRGSKLYQLGTLYSVWRATIGQEGYADPFDVNLAILRLLKGNRNQWPPQLRDCRTITFRAVRWFNPFEEACVAALNQKLKVRVQSALPAAHAEAAADRLGQMVRAEIMAKPWAGWTEDLGDAMAVNSPDVLQFNDAARISFTRSAGSYGEIEDLARRIGWYLQEKEMPANRMALIVPGISAVQDIVPHVFSRFRIPYYFRRGRPVLSSPVVKTFLSWLAFPLRPERDVLIDLIRNPAIEFSPREETAAKLAACPPRLKLDPEGSVLCFNVFPEKHSFTGLTASCAEALAMLQARMVEPEDHFNAAALRATAAALEGLGSQSLPLSGLLDLLEQLLENETVRPRNSREQGVWILNPHDAVDLEFDVVFFAGLNEGAFPSVPQQDALLNDQERYFLRRHLEEQGCRLPAMALPEAGVQLEQESILFLSALGLARNELVFSCQAVDHEGSEKNAGEYYRKLWSLAGWGGQEEPALSAYDQWRMARLGEDNVFSVHWEAQQGSAAEERVPMPGESFLPIVPLSLCRAPDEALQSAVQDNADRSSRSVDHGPEAHVAIGHLVEMLKVEAEREAFLETPVGAREPSAYCGQIGALKERVADWLAQKQELSPTALETLARCRYAFLLEHVFGLRDPRQREDTPDPMERGGLVHLILQKIYTAIAEGEAGLDAPRCWAVKADAGWMRRGDDGVDALPLAVFVPELEEEYVAFARRTANQLLGRRPLGHPGVWAAERKKVLEQVLNFVRFDAQTCAAENRYPALFEYSFGADSAVELGAVRLKGKVDRIDLIFAESGRLEKVRVLDYKGPSRARSAPEDYVEEIRRNLDCQLPVYAFAAQQFLFGAHNTAELNAMTEAGYLFYQRKAAEIAKTLKKSTLPMNEPELLDAFLATLFENLQRVKTGDFAVDPLIAGYTDLQSVCRTSAVALEELD